MFVQEAMFVISCNTITRLRLFEGLCLLETLEYLDSSNFEIENDQKVD